MILITSRVEILKDNNERRDCLDQNWNTFLLNCGITPVFCPNNLQVTKNLLDEVKISGIILSGGGNLKKYGGEAPERDLLEVYLLEYSMEHNIPLLGVCRGMHVIMDYFGVELKRIENHVRTFHLLNYQGKEITVNSYHTLGAIESTNMDLNVECRSEDGIIEMLKHNFYPINGIMWHPERENPFDCNDIALFKEIFFKT